MSQQVLDYRDIDKKNIILKKTIFHSNNYYTIPLKYRNRNIDSDIIFQSPLLHIPYGITEYITSVGINKYSLDFSLHDEKVNPEIKSFKKFIKGLDKFVSKKSLIWKKKKHKLESFIGCLKDRYNNETELVRFKINSENNEIDLNIFDSNKNQLNNFKIDKGMRGISLIHLKNMWYNSGNYGYMMYVIQIKINLEKPILKTYSFIDKDSGITDENETINSNMTCIKDDDRFSTYFKMLKFGIPVNNIKQRLQLVGLDPSIIDLDPNKPYYEETVHTETPNVILSGNDLLNGINCLKKPKPLEKLKEKLSNESTYKPPSLEDILATLHKIKNKKTDDLKETENKVKFIDSGPLRGPSAIDLRNGINALKKKKLNVSPPSLPTPSDLLSGIKNIKSKNTKNVSPPSLPTPADLLSGIKNRKSKNTKNVSPPSLPTPSDLLSGIKNIKSKNTKNVCPPSLPTPSDLLSGIKNIKSKNTKNVSPPPLPTACNITN
jgi:hypothetical protein